MINFLAFKFTEFLQGLFFFTLFIMAVRGLLLNLKKKNKLKAAGKAFSEGFPDSRGNQQSDDVLTVKQFHPHALALEKFQSVHGLPGYPPPTLWQRISGDGTPMELLFTRSALIFCDPSASESLKRTAVPLSDVISARTDYNTGSALIIKSSGGTIRCETPRTLGAKPAKKILDGMLRERRA
ncbi:hypothetical protein N9Z94_03180 [Akkermansiaceae bacterium]|nr:hypothetical protein [Akkermansiaceae bacterium]